jgi:trigger factor
MQVTKEQIEPCTIRLDFEIEAEQVGKAFDRAYREYGQYTRVPGFRPGKAPRAVLKKYLDADKVRQRAMEMLASAAYRDAIINEKIEPYDEPDVEVDDLSDESNWKFKAFVPLRPVVEVGSTEGLSVERPTYDPQDRDVDEKIEEVRGEHARLVRVEGRGVIEKDWVIAETLVHVEGDAPPEAPKRTLIRLGDNIPGFDEQLLGANPGDSKEFELTYPDDYQEAEKAGRKAKFNLNVVSISERILPELTDEWVKEVTGQETLAAWKSAILDTLKQSSKEYSDQVTESRIVEQILERSKVDYPRTLVSAEVERDMQELFNDLEQRETTYEEFLAGNNLSEEKHQGYLREKADRLIRTRLVLTDLAKREGATVSTEEIDDEFGRLFGEYEPSDKNVQKLMRDPQRRNQVANIILQRKVRDLLFSIAKIDDAPVPEE